MDPVFQYQFRLILIGDSTVGKSSMLKFFTDGKFTMVSIFNFFRVFQVIVLVRGIHGNLFVCELFLLLSHFKWLWLPATYQQVVSAWNQYRENNFSTESSR